MIKTFTTKQSNNSFQTNLKKGKKGESKLTQMLKSHYPEPDYHIHKWDYNTVLGKEMEEAGVDHTVTNRKTGFKIHIQCKDTLKLNTRYGSYTSLELYHGNWGRGDIVGRFLKGTEAHRWYHFDEYTNDAIYYDYPKQINYIWNHCLKQTGEFDKPKNVKENKNVYVYKAHDGDHTLFRLNINDELFDGRFTYLKYDKSSETWTATKFQSKYVK